MTINPDDFKMVKDDILKTYDKKGLEKTLEYCVLCGINLMAALHFIIEKNPDDKKACEKLDDLLEWYKEEIKEKEDV